MLDNERIENNYPWTIYLLVDLKVVFIITHIYISVISLISTTANSEATNDRQSGNMFKVTSSLSDVGVSEIDDAVLWNCRECSMTKRYYVFLYWMTFIALAVALISFCVVKVITLINVGWCGSDKRTLTKLWHMVVFKYLRENTEVLKKSEIKQPSEKVLVSLSKTIQLLNKNVADQADENYINLPKHLTSRKKFWNTVIPCWLVILLALTMIFSFLSYDLHPLTCITKPRDDNISYKNGKVEIKFPKSILIFQKVAFSIAAGLVLIVVAFVIAFYCLTYTVVNSIYEGKKDYIQQEIELQPVPAETQTTDYHDLTAQSITLTCATDDSITDSKLPQSEIPIFPNRPKSAITSRVVASAAPT
ncbi:uncharacterized protein [Dysidea avara]|uniref:uncharacterized protein n=1 Tax=Dysidea avara TaxID=196820 RepID=UPI00331FB4C9